jgi:dihydrofolate synthase/folylpolyglutamate synthase
VQVLPPEIRDKARCENRVEKTLAKAAEIAGPYDLICIAGSLYLIGEVRKQLLGELV